LACHCRWGKKPNLLSTPVSHLSSDSGRQKGILLKQTLEKLRKSLPGTIHALSSTVEKRDPYTAGHQRKVSSLSSAIAQ